MPVPETQSLQQNFQLYEIMIAFVAVHQTFFFSSFAICNLDWRKTLDKLVRFESVKQKACSHACSQVVEGKHIQRAFWLVSSLKVAITDQLFSCFTSAQ